MKYFTREWNHLKETLTTKHHIALFLDYDGTLAPICKRPEEATLNQEVRETLKYLYKLESVSLSIVSGRGLSDAKKMVGLTKLNYAGNHGLEIKGPDLEFELPATEDAKKTISEICRKLKKRLDEFPKVFVENKKFSLSIHYREVPFYQHKEVFAIIKAQVDPYLSQELIRVTEGKKVIEIRPPIDWHKGKAVEWLLKQVKSQVNRKTILPFYIGDDKTDEDAFDVINKNKGYSVRVGHAKGYRSKAKYFLRNPKFVHQFLDSLYDTLAELE